MISIPPFVLLVPYAAFLLGYAFFAFANVISLAKYGARNGVGLTASFVFIAVSAMIVFHTWSSVQAVDWTAAVPVGSIPEGLF